MPRRKRSNQPPGIIAPDYKKRLEARRGKLPLWPIIVIVATVLLGLALLLKQTDKPNGLRKGAAPKPTTHAISTPPGTSPIGKAPVIKARTYTTQPGDSLSRIAARLYGDSSQWRRIYNANRDTLTTPHEVPLGVVLIIPPRLK